MHFAALIASSFAVATATRPPIIPFVDQAPTPQWGAIKPGVYRFVNYATGTALSVKDSSADSQVVSMPVANDDNAQRWHVLDPVGGLGLSIMNNGTGKFITGLQVGQPVRAKTALPDDWNAIWAIQHGEFGPAPTDPMRIILRFLNDGRTNSGLEILEEDRTSGTPVYLTPGIWQKRSQGWYIEYLGQ